MSMQPVQMASTVVLVKISQCHTKSALERNFIAAAISRNPMTTLTEFIHPPARGNCVISCGASASKTKGIANASENPVMPTNGQRQLPCAASTSKVPTKGAVQVNEVREKVSPISSVPAMLPSFAEDAILIRFTSPEGNCRKKTP